MALEGTIKEFGLADIFQLIGLQKKTGILFLKSEDESIYIHFEDGMVVRTEESKKRPKYLIGNIFINRGRIVAGQLGEALEIQKSTGQKLGGVFIGQGLVNKDDLRDALSFQMNETIYKVFRWKGGDYKFDQCRVDYDRDTVSPLSSEHILMDGVRMLDEWPLIEKKLPSLDIVLARKIEPPQQDDSSADENDIFTGAEPKGKSKGSGIGKDLEYMLSLVDGKKSLYEILDFSKLGEFDTCKSLVDLLDKGYIVKTGARPEIMNDAPAMHEKPARKNMAIPLSINLEKLPYIFMVIALAIIILQVTGTRRIMSAHAKGLESIKVPFDLLKVEELRRNSILYYFDYGSYPPAPKTLEQLDYISKESMRDPWGNVMKIAINDKGGVTVVSSGPDGVFNTSDDISTHP